MPEWLIGTVCGLLAQLEQSAWLRTRRLRVRVPHSLPRVEDVKLKNKVAGGGIGRRMNSWLNTSHLKEDEKICQSCKTHFSGKETLYIKDDGNVVVKYVECDNCKSTLVLDVIRHEEIFD